MSLFKDASIPAVTAGFVAVLVSYSGPLAIFFQAAQSAEISTAMMAGILFQFGVGVFISLESVPTLTLGMILTYLVFKRLTPRYSLVALLVVGVGLAVVLEGASLVSFVTAFFGGITTVIAAITAAICTSKEAHEDPDKRYVAGVANGVFYLIGSPVGRLLDQDKST